MTDHIAFITPIYAGFFGIMLVVLSWRVTKLRYKHEGNKMLRDAGHNELTAAVRAQGNFIEYLPIALLLMWMLETMQFRPIVIHALGVLLVIARLMHVHGLNEPSGAGKGRRFGTRLTWLHIVICSLLAAVGSFGVAF
jgi:uncharacterized membrane protein YecN with MAPEG domain